MRAKNPGSSWTSGSSRAQALALDDLAPSETYLERGRAGHRLLVGDRWRGVVELRLHLWCLHHVIPQVGHLLR